MEVTGDQEPVVWNKDHQAQVMKGKRTKRSRLPSPLRLSMASSSSSACGRTSTDDNSGGSSSVVDMATATTTSTDQLRASTEEEDMANCLILLAQGHTREEPSSNNNDKAAPSGLYVYQCKTCDRCFPSFQALGGHRASHKKPKPNNPVEKLQPSVTFANEEAHHDPYDPNGTSFVLSLQTSNSCTSNTNNKPKVHECSICGAEFTSGQALGGHMRRHRTLLNNSATTTTCTTSMGNNSQLQQTNKPTTKNVLKLDLNLPAPEDDHRESKLSFQSKENVLVFSASSLVDCHY